jgi:hypothetical protein
MFRPLSLVNLYSLFVYIEHNGNESPKIFLRLNFNNIILSMIRSPNWHLISNFLYSTVCLYDRPTAYSKASSTHSVIWCFLLKFPSLSVFRNIQWLLTSSSPFSHHFPILPSIFPSITCFRRQFLRKMWPSQLPLLYFHRMQCIPFISKFPTRILPCVCYFLCFFLFFDT